MIDAEAVLIRLGRQRLVAALLWTEDPQLIPAPRSGAWPKRRSA